MSDTNVILLGRISFPTLFEPKVVKGSKGDPRYGCQLLIEKDTKVGKQEWNKVKAAIKAAIELGVKEKANWDGEVPEELDYEDVEDMTIAIIKDGDSRKVQKKNPEYAGYWVISMNSANRPEVVDRNLKEIIKPDKIKAGYWVKVDCNFYPFDKIANGISCGLNNVMFWEEDETFSKRRSAADAFGGEDDSNNEDDASKKKVNPKFKGLL